MKKLDHAKRMRGWIDFQLCEKYDDLFVRAMQARMEDGYWRVRESRLDDIDARAKAVYGPITEHYTWG